MAISLLMLTRDDIDTAIKNLETTRDSVDEQVIIDSSTKSENEKINKYAKTNPKIKLYSVVALGIPETVIPYGISKCSSNWILLMDADEFACPEFIKALKYMNPDPMVFKHSKPNAEGNLILRYESPERDFTTYQLRLFQKGKIEYFGFPHEHPKIYGRKEKLGNQYYLTHIKPINTTREYSAMQQMRTYTGEPRWKMALRDFYVIMKTNPSSLTSSLRENIRLTKATPEEQAIARITSRIGIVKYLELDKPEVMEALTKKYKGKQHGVQLLRKLIKEKYQRDRLEYKIQNQ